MLLNAISRLSPQVASLFRDESSTEFVIATIPTVLAATESGRLLRELRKEGIPCKRMIINQVKGL